MLTLGIDLSSMPPGTAASLVRWDAGQAVAAPPMLGCDDATLDEVIRQADAVGIDAPLGWPVEFASAVGHWTHRQWDEGVRDRMRFRETDRHARRRHGLSPLSVSSDRIALPAMRAMALLCRHGVEDRSGDGRFFEVYPAGSLKLWGVGRSAYKRATPQHARERRTILGVLRERMPWLEAGDEHAATADALDALIASLTVRAAMQGRTDRPGPDHMTVARSEGWIHLPLALPSPVR